MREIFEITGVLSTDCQIPIWQIGDMITFMDGDYRQITKADIIEPLPF